jgi:hypothetical protein
MYLVGQKKNFLARNGREERSRSAGVVVVLTAVVVVAIINNYITNQ